MRSAREVLEWVEYPRKQRVGGWDGEPGRSFWREKDTETAEYLAECVRLRQGVESFVRFMEDNWGAEEVEVKYVLKQLRDAMKGNK